MSTKPVIEFYESAEDLPIRRFQRFNKLLMIDTEVGNTFDDYDIRTQKTIEFLNKQMYAEAIKELQNRRQMVYHAFEEYSPKHFALAIMVKSIDGKPFTDMSEKGLSEVLELLNESGYTEKQLGNDISDVKKKSLSNWSNISRNILRAMRRKTIT